MATGLKLKGDVIFRGHVAWGLNEDALKSIDVAIPAAFRANEVDSDQVILSIVNGSATVDLVAYIGDMRKLITNRGNAPYEEISVAPDATDDDFTSADDHGLVVGQAVAFSGTGGGVTAGTTYYIATTSTSKKFRIAESLGGAAIALTGAVANTVAKVDAGATVTPTAASDIFTATGPHGFAVGDEVYFTGTGGGVTANLAYWIIAVPSATTFQVSTLMGGALFNVTDATANTVIAIPDTPTGNITVIPTGGATDDFTAAANHGLRVGQALTPTASNDDLTAGTLYYVITTSTPKKFQLSTARGGAKVEVTDTDMLTLVLAEEFHQLTSATVEKFAAASSTVPAPSTEEVVVTGWPNPAKKGRIILSKSAATAAAFTVLVEIRRA